MILLWISKNDQSHIFYFLLHLLVIGSLNLCLLPNFKSNQAPINLMHSAYFTYFCLTLFHICLKTAKYLFYCVGKTLFFQSNAFQFVRQKRV